MKITENVQAIITAKALPADDATWKRFCIQALAQTQNSTRQMSALAVWFSPDHSGFLNERFQMKRTMEFKILKEINMTGREKACFVYGYTICDL